MMPLIVKDFSWQQTSKSVTIVVPIRGVKADKTDILTSKNYIRIHYHPYIFEAFLFSEVEDIEGGSCTIDSESGSVLIQLPKVIPDVQWPTLEVQGLDRIEKKTIREEAVSTSHKRHEEQAKLTAERRNEQRQLSVREQIRLDDEEKQRVAAIKRAESSKALADMKEWTTKDQMQKGQTISHVALPPPEFRQQQTREPFENRLANVKTPSITLSYPEGRGPTLEELIEQGPPDVDILDSDSSSKVPPQGAAKYLEKKSIWSNAEKSKLFDMSSTLSSDKIPGIRESSHISVQFTPREFPTPARESSASLEEEWLTKQAEARKTQGFNDADLRPEERDPFWLLDKGRSLMKSECHLGAVSAFCLGIKLAPKMPELYVERARAQYSLMNFVKAVEDASYALELLTPKVSANAQDRLKCHMTRANGFQQLKLLKEALMDFKEARILDPKNDKLNKQIAELEEVIEEDKFSLSDEDCD